MKRIYNTGTDTDITLFTGVEVEKTPAFGLHTLFVVGVHSADKILKFALNNQINISHIYFGANQSFRTNGINDIDTWAAWEDMIKPCLAAGYWCTLDFDVTEVEGVHESGLCENRKFIPMISVKIPYIEQLNYNATIKLDDLTFDATNPGVWCHWIRQLTTRESFTEWDQYSKDNIIL